MKKKSTASEAERLAHGLKNGYRSGLEEKIGAELDAKGIAYGYESMRIIFEQPAKTRSYTPDFILPNGIIVESKGRFVTADRQKHLLVKQQHPDLDIRFVFVNPNQKINKNSDTTYAMWCQKNGFQFAKGSIPDAWICEKKRKTMKKGA